MPETESDSIDIELSRLNYNILKAIENNYEAFIRLNKLDKAYIKFRLQEQEHWYARKAVTLRKNRNLLNFHS